MVCRPIVTLRDNLLLWFVLITWSKWVQWQYKCRSVNSARVNNDYPIRNNYYYILSLREVNDNFKSFKLKTSFLKTTSKIIILLPARGKMCNSTVWCSKVLCLEMLMCVSCRYKKDDIKFTIKLQNKFLYFCHQISL